MAATPLQFDPPRDARLLVDGPAAGAWNMGVDEALLESAAEGGGPTLRFYQWEEATLSLGYFQSRADRATHPSSAACPLVRRQTGGGAILHDRELTYSVCVPKSHPLASDTQTLYDHWHGALIQALKELGVPAARCERASGLKKSEEPFLCFQRRAVGDVLLDGYKIAGSAQRRGHGAVLQHGGILLAASPAAPELPGVAELAGVAIAPAELIERWLPILGRGLDLRFQPGSLSPSEVERSRELTENKYDGAAWTARR
jgi:lipoate-protein ligase A